MRITFISFGTRGDVQPALALAKALRMRGHRVRMVAGANFKAWIEGHGVEAVPTSVDVQAMMASDLGKDWVEYGTNLFYQARFMRRLFDQASWQMALDVWQGCQESDLVISSLTSDVFTTSAVERLGVRHISIALQPAMIATRSGAAVMYTPYPKRDSIVNYWISRLFMERGVWQICRTVNNRLRKEVLGLPAQSFAEYRARFQRIPILHGYSQHALPHPNDWPPNLHTVGYWFLDEGQDWQAPAALLRFLAAGSQPIGVGFGSMTGHNPQKFTQLLIDAIQRSGERAVLLSGWSGIGNQSLPTSIYRLDAAPHDWLFPRLAATIHHGGAGTTAASFRAGVPVVAVPHMAEQPLWGRRIEALGVGPQAIVRPKVTVDRLACAINEAVNNPTMRQKAQELGAKIRLEDGIAAAVQLIEQ